MIVTGIFKALCVTSALGLASMPVLAHAASWYKDTFGDSTYSGQILLNNGMGSESTFERYDSSATAPLWGTSVVQSPIVVASASQMELDISMMRTGVEATKYLCDAGQDWNVTLSVTNFCANGVAHDISGVRLSVDDIDATTWKPLMHVHVAGYGWLEVSNSDCGVVEAKQFCTAP
ncbi:hypothetical protein LCGC14_0328110 [marine sediment metagenome]|uniref:Uncharacterized protein n=1 Tax=marine sediment metagenome TaxID=412755 RepID=A0A0F9TZY0_9ZZZZ